jgi:dTMP kinase
MKRGKFVVLEGGDGAGKDTQVALLRKELGDEQITYTRDPGGTALGNQLREVVQHGKEVADETELLLFLASRAQLVQEVILPSLDKGKNVICNRFDYSTIAYQLYGRSRPQWREFLRVAGKFVRDELKPDLVVLLDVSPDVALGRLVQRGEQLSRFEQEKLEFHNRVRQGYLESVQEYPTVAVIDASRSIEAVYKDVSAAVKKTLTL